MTASLRVEGKKERALAALRQLSQEAQLEVFMQMLREPARPDRADIDVAPFRESFLVQHGRDDLHVHIVAERMGWFRGDYKNGDKPKGDGTRVRRILGLEAQTGHASPAYWTVRRHINYDTAVALADALNLDYVDCDV